MTSNHSDILPHALSVAEVISTRYSVRQFDPHRSIGSDQMDQILSAAVQAPSARNQQPYHLYVIVEGEARDRLQSCYGRPGFADAAAYVLVAGRDADAWHYTDGRDSSLYTDAAIATAYMQLQAWELGVASVWVCAFDRDRCAELFEEELEGRVPISILVLGYPAADFVRVPRRRKEPDDLITKL